MKRPMVTLDGNQAVANVAYKLNEVIAIYPITPSSPIGEWADQWSAVDIKNIWGSTPDVMEMQSEGGAAGTVHGALQAGALTTTFTASQGLLLMIPNMYKIAGELTSSVFHVAARSIAAQALSIFGDHSDVMATRATGFAMLASNSVQEAMDMAVISQSSTLRTRIPFLHFFDGFRTSHEVSKVEQVTDEDLEKMIDNQLVREHRSRGLTPDKPVIRGTAQNPDVFFQARETVNKYYNACPGIVQSEMDKFGDITGRYYKLFDYVGDPEAERIIIMIGSGAETVHETVDYLNKNDEKVGVLKVRLYRPFSNLDFYNALPSTVKSIAVLDRTKEPGSIGEPLYLDILSSISEGLDSKQLTIEKPRIIGGRYGLSSKEFTPSMVSSIFNELAKEEPKNHFTIGIFDDVTNSSLEFDNSLSTGHSDTVKAIFYGLGSDGTVGANKNSIKIIGESTDNFAQGYFVYDSKKAGSRTISHLRFGPEPIRSTYLITRANFIACHQFTFLERVDVLEHATPNSTFLLNSPYSAEEVWEYLPIQIQKKIIENNINFYVVDGYKVAKEAGMGQRINTILQVCFFAISGVIETKKAIIKIKEAIKKTYGKRGEKVVQSNYRAVDLALSYLEKVEIPAEINTKFEITATVPENAPIFVRNVLGKIMDGAGDLLPVSAFPVDGTYPVATTQWEKRNLSLEIPVWDEEICIQCGKCAFVCPHAVIRQKVYSPDYLSDSPETFKSADARWKEFPDRVYSLQVAPEDCTGCNLCVEVCPVKDKKVEGRKALNMEPQLPLRNQERENWDYFLSLPEIDRTEISFKNVKNSQLLQPLFEFSGACLGCGETPYLKLLSQLFGDRALIANATGCSSIYGGNLPATPWAKNNEGRGPSWSNSLFEDNAEFGLGMRLTLDKQVEYANELLQILKSDIGQELVDELTDTDQSDELGIQEQRARVEVLKSKLSEIQSPKAVDLLSLADKLVKKSVWIVGGDGWAYDIGYGGLDHAMSTGRNVNILVLDTEVYSNTGGQASKSTPRAAIAKFASHGKDAAKKDLGLMAMAYGNVYVASIAMGASDTQTMKAFHEAESYDGPSMIIAYSQCIAHGIDMKKGMDQQKLAVKSGFWPLYRFDPRLADQNKNPLKIDSRKPSIPFTEYAYTENRYRQLLKIDPVRAKKLMESAVDDVQSRWTLYQQMAEMNYDSSKKD